MPKITIQSATAVLVDGQNYGKVADTIANNNQLASDIQIALEAWVSELESQTKAVADEAETRIAAVTAENTRLSKLLADASAAFDAGDIAKLTAMRAAALQTENEKKRATALAKKAEAEAEIAALTE
jgi:hypothetical protein